MSNAPAFDEAVAAETDERFLDLVLSDEELLAAEFDAIVAGSRLAPPADRRSAAANESPTGRTTGPRSSRSEAPVGDRGVEDDAPPRNRSPPLSGE